LRSLGEGGRKKSKTEKKGLSSRAKGRELHEAGGERCRVATGKRTKSPSQCSAKDNRGKGRGRAKMGQAKEEETAPRPPDLNGHLGLGESPPPNEEPLLAGRGERRTAAGAERIFSQVPPKREAQLTFSGNGTLRGGKVILQTA